MIRKSLILSLESGDLVRLYSNRMFNANQSVTVKGAVKSPGEFFLKSDMTIVDAILEAGGIADNVLYSRVDLSRLNPESVSIIGMLKYLQ